MKSHPKIKVPASGSEKVCNWLSVLVLIGSFIYVILEYTRLPETIPTHFNTKGIADDWGEKATIFIMPCIALLLFIIMYFVSKAPHVFNYTVNVTEENAPRLYSEARLFMAVLNFETVAMFTYITWEMTQTAKGGITLGIWFISIFLVVPLVTIILFIRRMNRLE